MNLDLLERVRQQVEAVFAFPADLREVNGLPADSLESRRGQHSSTKILRWIITTAPPGAAKVLGITDVDLFIPVLTFVFGEAQVKGLAAVVSLTTSNCAQALRHACWTAPPGSLPHRERLRFLLLWFG